MNQRLLQRPWSSVMPAVETWDDWRVFLKPAEAAEVEQLERSSEHFRQKIAVFKKRLDRIRNRAMVRRRYRRHKCAKHHG